MFKYRNVRYLFKKWEHLLGQVFKSCTCLCFLDSPHGLLTAERR